MKYALIALAVLGVGYIVYKKYNDDDTPAPVARPQIAARPAPMWSASAGRYLNPQYNPILRRWVYV
jgi:hypothetical protein